MLTRTLASWGRLLGLGKADSGFDEDRRLWGRLACDVRTTCKPTRYRDANDLPARVRNISMGGACLELSIELPPGELLSLALPGRDASSSRILACVVRCDPAGAAWEVGCTFASPLTRDEMRQFDRPGSAPAAADPADRRVWDRYPSRASATYQVVRAPELTDPLPAEVINVSSGGLALCPREPLDIGDLLSVELANPERHVVTALASVVRVGREGGQLVVGCNFIRELSDDNLALLLG